MRLDANEVRGTIGREGNLIRIREDAKAVSRNHLIITSDRKLIDNSTNGTMVLVPKFLDKGGNQNDF